MTYETTGDDLTHRSRSKNSNVYRMQNFGSFLNILWRLNIFVQTSNTKEKPLELTRAVLRVANFI